MANTNELLALMLTGSAIGLSAASSPGPFQLYIITETLTKGWRRGATIAFAPLLSDILIVPIILLTLTQLSDTFLQGIQLGGGALLLYMAWNTWQQLHKPAADPTDAPKKEKNGLAWSILMIVLSPGPYLFWTLVNGPLLLEALDKSTLMGLAFLVSFYGSFIGALIGIAILFHQARHMGEKAVRSLLFASLFIFIGFAIYLFWQVLGPSQMI